MDDYISREAAILEFCDDCIDKKWCKRNGGSCSKIRNINAVPAADVRPVVHGAWVPYERIKGYDVCSACHNCYIDSDWKGIKWKFCPNCGADMREVKADGEG